MNIEQIIARRQKLVVVGVVRLLNVLGGSESFQHLFLQVQGGESALIVSRQECNCCKGMAGRHWEAGVRVS